MSSSLNGVLDALPLGLALSITCLGARPILKRGGMLSLSLALYFAFGAYIAGWSWNQTVRPGTTGSLLQILAGLVAALLGTVLLALPNLVALRRGLRGHFYSLFSLAYGVGLWSAMVNLRVFTHNFDGLDIHEPWPRKNVIILVTAVFIVTLVIVYWIERGWRGTSLDWIRQDVHDQAIYGINELRLLIAMELVAACTAGLAGSCYAILLQHPQREWGEPASLVLIVLGCLLSASYPWTTVLTSTALAVVRPWISINYPSIDLVTLGLALFLVSVYRKW